MNVRELQERLTDIQQQMAKFKEISDRAEQQYKRLLKAYENPRARSVLMEHHLIRVERQREMMAKLEQLHRQLKQQLALLGSPN